MCTGDENQDIKKREIWMKIIRLAGIIFFIICMCCNGFFVRYHIGTFINTIFPPAPIEKINLTEKQKLEDFDFFFEAVTTGMPMIDSYSSLYGFNIKEKQEYYRQLIQATASDAEFYSVMSAISQEIPSFHTDLVYPDSIGTLHCYNSKKINADRKIISYNRYWKDLLEHETDKNLEYFVFSYIDGSYVYNSYESSVDQWQEPVELIAVDDRNIDEYITWQVFIYNLYYDGVNKKPCRTKIVFNNSEGTPVNVTLKTQDGSVMTRQLYYSIYAEDSFLRSVPVILNTEDYSIHETDEYAYVEVNNMVNLHGEELLKELFDLKNEKIILDLRENYGGSQTYAAKYIYPALFSEDVDEKNRWYMPDSPCNKTITKDIANKLILRLKKAEDAPYHMETGNKMMYSEVSQSYKGKAAFNKEVIILTSRKTGSAADRFASDMQKNHLASVMGNHTGGEGLMNSYNSVSLPNSRLVFIYMPGGAWNPDGSDNSVCGTKPDIYDTQTIDDFYRYQQLLNEDADVLDFNTRLKYDTVLRNSVKTIIQ